MDHHVLQLRAKGKLVRMEWDPAASRHVEVAVTDDELAWHLHDSVCLATGTTLRDVLMLVRRDLDLFGSLTACDCLCDLMIELDERAEPTSEVVALELSWAANIVRSGPDTVLVSSTEFCGHGGEGQVAIEFMPVNRLADLPVLLNEAFNVRDEGGSTVFSATKRFSLLSLVDGVVEELTFLGSPEKRDEAMAELRSRIDSVDESECYTIEEVRDEWEKRADTDKRRFPCRLCGEDSRCACFGKPGDLCHNCFQKTKEN